MTDAAFVDDAPVQDAPPPAAEPSSRQDSGDDRADLPPRAVESQPKERDDDDQSEAEEAKEKKPTTARDAIAKATRKVEDEARKAEEADAEEDADAEAQQKKAQADQPEKPDQERQSQQARGQDKPPQQRAPDGKFAADEYADAPARFTNDAKAEWQNLPAHTRSEVHRAVNELTRGLENAENRATKYESIKEFDDLAESQGTTLRQAMHNYVSIEMMLRRNPIEGLERICSNLGTTLRDVAAHVLGQNPNQGAAQQERVISDLKKELNQLRYDMHGLQGVTQQQQQAAEQQQTAEYVASWASQPGHERAEELADDIANLITSGRVATLDDAYALAVALKPAPSNPGGSNPPPRARDGSNPSSRSAPDDAQTVRRGAMSVSGAPGRGSDPDGKRPPSSTARDAVRRAMARVG